MKKVNNKKLIIGAVAVMLAMSTVGYAHDKKGDTKGSVEEKSGWRQVEEYMSMGYVLNGVACDTREHALQLTYGSYYMGFGEDFVEAMLGDGKCYRVARGKIDKLWRMLRAPNGDPLILITITHGGKTSWGVYTTTTREAQSPKEQSASLSKKNLVTHAQQRVFS